MTNEKRYCVLVGKPDPALHHLEQALQDRFEVITAESDEAAVLAAGIFHPMLAVIPNQSDSGTCRLRTRMEDARPGIAIVHIGNHQPADPAAARPAPIPTAPDTARPAPIAITAAPARPAPTPTAAGPASHPATVGPARTATEAGNGRRHREPRGTDEQTARVTHRERQVLTLLERGLSMKQAARLLGISPRTVAFHKYHAMASNGLHSNAELLDFVIREGILALPEADENGEMKLPPIDPRHLD